MLEPIIYTIEVPCDQEMAFNVFAKEMGDWWPLDKRCMSMKDGKSAKSLLIEAQSGGKITEISEDGTEYLWGTIKSYLPFNLLSMDFHMGFPPEMASLVEVQFKVIKEDLTQVTLTQSNWEAFGDMAEMMRGGYGSSWGLIFEQAYKSACGGDSHEDS